MVDIHAVLALAAPLHGCIARKKGINHFTLFSHIPFHFLKDAFYRKGKHRSETETCKRKYMRFLGC